MLVPTLRALGAALAVLAAASLAWSATADELYSEAAQHYEARQWQAAAEAFTQFAEENPDHERAPAALFYGGEALVQLGDHAGAVGQLSAMLERAPQHRFAKTAQFRIGESLLLSGKFAEAATALVEFRKAHPADDLNAFVLVYLGDIAVEAGDLAEGQSRYELALREFPQGALAINARFGLARCQQLAGKRQAALAAYEQLAASGHSLSDDAQLQVGVIRYEQKNYRGAEEALVAIGGADHRLRPQVLYWLGLAQLADKRPKDAIGTLQTAAEEAGETTGAAGVYCALADALRQSGDNAGADSAYRLVVERWPQNQWADEALYGRLTIAESTGQPEAAEAFARELLHRYADGPYAAAARVAYARALVSRGSYAPAERLLVETIEQAGTNGTANGQIDGLKYYLALCQSGQGRHEEALRTIDGIGPSNELAAPLREARIAALSGLGQHEAALPLLRKQLEETSSPEAQSRIRGQMVLALAQLKQYPAAAEEAKSLGLESLAHEPVAAAVLLVAEEAYRTRELPLAKELFEKLTHPQVPAAVRGQALSGLAWTQFQAEGNLASAETFERLLKDYPESPLAAEAALVRGRTLEDTGRHDAALTAYKLVVERYGQSPQAPAALLAAGRLHAKLRQLREAEAALLYLLKEHPKFDQSDLALYELAWVLDGQNKRPEAELAFARLSQDYPQSKFWGDATWRLADRAAKAKDREKAAALAQSLINSDCDGEIRQSALYLRGQLAAAAGQWEVVAQSMNQLVQQYPESPSRLSAEFWSAEADFRRGDVKTASEKLDRIIAQSDGRNEPWLAMVPFRKAQCLALEKQWTEALTLAESIRSHYPQFKQLHDVDYLIGRSLGSLGRLDEARGAYQRVVDSPTAVGTETAAMSQWMVGETLFHQKRFEEAVVAYERGGLQAGYPQWQAACLLQAGKCRLLLGQTSQAQAHFAKVAGDLANTPYATEAAEQLAAVPTTATASRPATIRSE